MNKDMRFRFCAALFVGVFFVVLCAGAQIAGDTGAPQHLRVVDLHIGSATLHTEVAANETQREIGLMHVAKMGDNDGMIFLMPAVERVSFWMKDTLIPLSIAFIDPNGTILEIHDMKAMDTTTLNSDSTQVAYALETNLHWFALNGIKPGDHLSPAPATLGKPEP